MCSLLGSGIGSGNYRQPVNPESPVSGFPLQQSTQKSLVSASVPTITVCVSRCLDTACYSSDSADARTGRIDDSQHQCLDVQLAEANLMLLLITLLVSLLSFHAQADSAWFERHGEGWFWYEKIPEKQPNSSNHPVLPKAPSTDSLSVAWLRNNISKFLDKAIDQPTKENVSAYLYLDRAMKDKAERFAQTGKSVIENDPLLDENVRRPLSPAAAKLKDELAYKAKENVLKKLAQITGLVFYYQGAVRCAIFRPER